MVRLRQAYILVLFSIVVISAHRSPVVITQFASLLWESCLKPDQELGMAMKDWDVWRGIVKSMISSKNDDDNNSLALGHNV